MIDKFVCTNPRAGARWGYFPLMVRALEKIRNLGCAVVEGLRVSWAQRLGIPSTPSEPVKMTAFRPATSVDLLQKRTLNLVRGTSEVDPERTLILICPNKPALKPRQRHLYTATPSTLRLDTLRANRIAADRVSRAPPKMNGPAGLSEMSRANPATKGSAAMPT